MTQDVLEDVEDGEMGANRSLNTHDERTQKESSNGLPGS